MLMLEGRKGTTATVFLLGLCKPFSGVIKHSVADCADTAESQIQHFSHI